MKTAAAPTPSGTRAAPADRRSARERLLAAADELFYEGGIHTVGIDRVIDRAGVAKATLYDVFGSKDALIRAYLEARHATRKARLTSWLERYATPREKLLGVFDAMADQMKAKGFRGCAFTRAGSESAAGSNVRGACDEARDWMRGLFVELGRGAGVAAPEALATQLCMLYDGASVMGQIEGSPAAAVAARGAAEVLLDGAPGASTAKAKASSTRPKAKATPRKKVAAAR